jgi:hypothetical protein
LRGGGKGPISLHGFSAEKPHYYETTTTTTTKQQQQVQYIRQVDIEELVNEENEKLFIVIKVLKEVKSCDKPELLAFTILDPAAE